MCALPPCDGRFHVASRRTGHAPFVTHPALQKAWQSQAFPSMPNDAGRRGPAEHMLLDRPSRQSRLVGRRLLGCLEPQSLTHPRFGAFLIEPVEQTQTHIPADTDEQWR